MFVLAYDDHRHTGTVLRSIEPWSSGNPNWSAMVELFSIESMGRTGTVSNRSLTATRRRQQHGDSEATYTTPLPGVDRSTGQDVVFEFPVQE